MSLHKLLIAPSEHSRVITLEVGDDGPVVKRVTSLTYSNEVEMIHVGELIPVEDVRAAGILPGDSVEVSNEKLVKYFAGPPAPPLEVERDVHGDPVSADAYIQAARVAKDPTKPAWLGCSDYLKEREPKLTAGGLVRWTLSLAQYASHMAKAENAKVNWSGGKYGSGTRLYNVDLLDRAYSRMKAAKN